MSMSWDWSPALNAFNQYAKQQEYNKTIKQMFGSPQINPVQVTPQVSQPQVGLPGGPQMPNGPGASPLSDPSRQAAYNAPAQSYSGPVGQSLGFDQSAALAPLLQGLDPSMGMPLLLQTLQSGMARKTKLDDYKAQSDIDLGHSENLSKFNVQQGVDNNRITPITDQNDPRLPPVASRAPGSMYGVDASGNVVQTIKSDAKSGTAMQQEKDLVKAKEDADIAKANAMYGVGPGGQQQDFTKPLSNSAFESVASSIANYDRSEATAISRYPAPVRAIIQARVSAINPDYTQTDYNAANATKVAFAKGPQAQSIQSLNSTISHMDLMKQYVTALNNGDVQTVNALKNALATEFGGTAPTNAQAVAEILGPEMAKAVLPNGGTGLEREGFINTLKQKASQGQLIGTLDTYQGLMAGQLLSLKKRYMNIPGHPKDFEGKFLLPETQHILSSRPEYQGGAVNAGDTKAPTPDGGKPQKLSPQAAANLPAGTHFIGEDGVERVRH